MKNVIKFLILKINKTTINIFIFIVVIIFIDIILFLIFRNNINEFTKYSIEVLEDTKFKVGPDRTPDKETWIVNINWYPYWEFSYRWSFIYEKNKQRKCRVIGVWGSIIRWMWVKWEETYFYNLSKRYNNTEFINLGIPWSMPLQQIMKLEKEDILHDTNILIWEIWHDDFTYYTFSNGFLYNSKVILNNYWNVSLFKNMNSNLNNILLNTSVLYNKLLKIKSSFEIAYSSTYVTEKYILEKVKAQSENFLSLNTNNKIIFLFSTYLWTKNKKDEDDAHIKIYDKFRKILSYTDSISFLDSNDLLNSRDLSIYNFDDIHLNIKWNEVMWEGLYNYIKTNKLLDEKCY